MKHLLFLVLVLGCSIAQGQENIANIKGRIIGLQGNIADVSVFIKGTKMGTSTNNHGDFMLKIPAGNYTLLLQHVAYQAIEINVQVKAHETISVGTITLSEKDRQLEAVVVTGQFSPQSVRNSVYQIRTISNEQIRLRGATNIQAVLNTELGIRLSNDLTLGTTDIQLMGMSGQNVKILLDGIPMVDRGSTRESLGQIDVNTIDRIEIVEGPMSVTYGSDALAGVINIITKKSLAKAHLSISARLQEETTGKEYNLMDGNGTHNTFLGTTYQKKHWEFTANVSRNFFGGWQGSLTERKKEWMPKEQYLFATGVGYRNEKLSLWYRFNGTNETLKSLGNTYINSQTNRLSATDQYYISTRWFHQVQGDFQWTPKTSLTAAVSYTDYSRQTQTTDIDLVSNYRTLNLTSSQDKSVFNTAFVRITAQHKLSNFISLQQGIETSLNSSSGERILGTPSINEYAYFISSEWKLGSNINIRPGLRFIQNSVYNAPPVIPSINTKLTLSRNLDLRLAYAKGFRSPALRELYFTFFDSSHSIRGNTNLKAENSDSFNGSLTYQFMAQKMVKVKTSLSGFYNHFNNLISLGSDPTDATISTYLNIDTYKTVGFTINNHVVWKNIQGSIGLSHIGRYNRLAESNPLPNFVWSNEVNTTVLYNHPKSGTSLSVFYKFTGKQPIYQSISTSEGSSTRLSEIASFHTADMTISQVFGKNYTLIGGIKNVFDVTTIQNTAGTTDTAHSTGGAIPMSYGRSFFLGISANL
jgi:outer membrane receptor for ferrienterochelin and colicins